MASLQFHAAVLLSVGLIAGCGGDRTRGGAGADTTGAVGVSPDSTAAAPAPSASASRDTAAPAAGTADTAAKASAASRDTAKSSASAPRDSGKKSAAAPSSGAKKKIAAASRTAHAAASKPSAQATHDTARVQAAESTNSAATPAPAPTPQQQDTSKVQDTSKTQDTTKAAAAESTQDQPLRDAYHQAPRDTVDQATYDGWKQFNLNCARCHGEDVLGTTIAPHLIMSLKPDGPINTKELFMQTVCAGRPTKGMPSWCALGLDMNKISDIYLYVKGRSDAKLAPGRPAVKPGT